MYSVKIEMGFLFYTVHERQGINDAWRIGRRASEARAGRQQTRTLSKRNGQAWLGMVLNCHGRLCWKQQLRWYQPSPAFSSCLVIIQPFVCHQLSSHPTVERFIFGTLVEFFLVKTEKNKIKSSSWQIGGKNEGEKITNKRWWCFWGRENDSNGGFSRTDSRDALNLRLLVLKLSEKPSSSKWRDFRKHRWTLLSFIASWVVSPQASNFRFREDDCSWRESSVGGTSRDQRAVTTLAFEPIRLENVLLLLPSYLNNRYRQSMRYSICRE